MNQAGRPEADVDALIVTVRGHRVILSPDLAGIYGVETRTLNQAVKRNRVGFPGDFLLELTQGEAEAKGHEVVVDFLEDQFCRARKRFERRLGDCVLRMTVFAIPEQEFTFESEAWPTRQ